MATRRRPAKKKSPRALSMADRELLDAEFARQDRREQGVYVNRGGTIWLRDAEQAAKVPAKRRGKCKLTDADWDIHVGKHSLDALGANGKRLTAERRRRWLEEEQGISVDRSTVTKRLHRPRV
jgi:hypothetical protein